MIFLIKSLIFQLFITSISSIEIPILGETLKIVTNDCNYQRILKDLNDELNARQNAEINADWNYSINMTKHNEEIKNEISKHNAKYMKEIGLVIKNINPDDIVKEDTKRQLKKLTNLKYAVLPDEDFEHLLSATSKMEDNYSKVKVCSFDDSKKCDLELDPDIDQILMRSRNPDELKHYWIEFYNKFASMRKHFKKYVIYNKKAAKLNNFYSGAEAWLDEYEDPSFESELEEIFNEFKPLYEQFHGYIRWRLREKYGKDIMTEKGSIPMHLLNNLWAESWTNILDFTIPFPEVRSINVTKEMIDQNYTTLKMFQLGDEFFQSLGLIKLPDTFWNASVMEKINDREMKCHPEAFDFFGTNDVRILMCTKVDMENLITIHHELGHIQYFLQYQNLPFIYREGANPGFHEAIGDVLALAISTPKHLEKIKILKNYTSSTEEKINRIFEKGLDLIPFLPFAYTIDLYRWGVFRGKIKPKEYNCAFWKLRNKYSGIEPPVQRSEKHFDPAAKMHISEDIEYLRYLVAHIIQYQIYQAMCEKAEQYVVGSDEFPLHDCDFYGSEEAGLDLQTMLAMGASKPWPDAMEVITGQRKMSIKPLMEYYQPLREWIEKFNKENNVTIGWEESKMCQ